MMSMDMNTHALDDNPLLILQSLHNQRCGDPCSISQRDLSMRTVLIQFVCCMKYGMNFVVNTTKEWKYVSSHCMMYANTFTQWIMLEIYISRDMTNEIMILVSVKQKLASENKQYVKGPRGLSPTLIFPIHPPRLNKCKIISSIWYRTS